MQTATPAPPRGLLRPPPAAPLVPGPARQEDGHLSRVISPWSQAELDAQHDGLVRGMYAALTTLAQVSSTGEEELLRLRDLLFPDGLEHTQRTYRGQAGHAAMVAARLDDGVRAGLEAVNLHDKNLLALVETWLATAQKLGQLEEERARLVAPAATSAAQINTARLGWIRVTNAVIANADLAQLDDATDRLLFASLRAAERTAEARSGTGSAVVERPKARVQTGSRETWTPAEAGNGSGRTLQERHMAIGPPRDELEELFDELGELHDLRAGIERKVFAHDIKRSMRAKRISPAEMVRRIGTTREEINRLLDPTGSGAPIEVLGRAALALGLTLRVPVEPRED